MSLETNEAEEYIRDTTQASHSTTSTTSSDVPHNLPTLETSLGYQELATFVEEDDELTTLENHAHEKKVLLSSDAMRYFLAEVTLQEKRLQLLNAVVAQARVSYPSEDGWVVLNLSRMELMLEAAHIALSNTTDSSESFEKIVTFLSPGVGSLAEAIVMKNLTLALELVSGRPMIALADAVSDLSNVVRAKNGEAVTVSNFLKIQTSMLSKEKLEEVLQALSSALDGTYTNEQEAVAQAIEKAISVLQ